MNPPSVVEELVFVWAWIQTYGGTMGKTLITLNKRGDPRHTVPFRGESYLSDAAKWISDQMPNK